MPRTRYNPGQYTLEGIDDTPAPTDRLFFAILPDAETAERIGALANELRGKHHLTGRPIAAERLHVSLYHVGDFLGIPPGIVADASAAAATVAAQPFQVTFDRAMSFSGAPGNQPFVLSGGEGLAALVAFQQALFGAMARAGVNKKAKEGFTPHLTLMYDGHRIAEQPVAEISWTVREFVLVHSLIGRTQHVPLGRWPLAES